MPSDDAGLDSGRGSPRDVSPGTVVCPDVPLAVQIFPDGGPTECICLHKNSDGNVARIPCGYGLCVSSANAGWFCDARQQLFYVPGLPLDKCEAGAIPADAQPCDPGF